VGGALARGGPKARGLYREMVRALRGYQVSRGDRFREKVMEYWIGLESERRGKVFAEIRLGKSHLEVFILPAKRQLSSWNGFVQGVSPSKGWGWFRSRLWVRSHDDLDATVRLLLKSRDFA